MCFHILLNTVIKDFRNREVRETSSREGVTVSKWGVEISKVKKGRGDQIVQKIARMVLVILGGPFMMVHG